jgi:hypothetical protein
MLDSVQGHPTIVCADQEFAYSKRGQKLFRLDECKNLHDMKTGKWIGKSLKRLSLDTPVHAIEPQD